jgi:hypothetical protein
MAISSHWRRTAARRLSTLGQSVRLHPKLYILRLQFGQGSI